jgi:uncharacterized protein (TIGR02246 family)
MMPSERPVLAAGDGAGPADEFVRGLQAAVDTSDPDLFNQAFAQDVLWGSPFGAIVSGYDEIHAIHAGMFAAASPAAGGGSRYEIEHTRRVADDVALAYVRRFSQAEPTEERPGRADAFDELALMVFVRRDGRWWLAAALPTPARREVYSCA